MRFRVHSNLAHGRRFLGDYPTLDSAHTAAACAHPGSQDECLCGGGSVVAVIETEADRAFIGETADGMRYAYDRRRRLDSNAVRGGRDARRRRRRRAGHRLGRSVPAEARTAVRMP
jgi:hypothetical protein